MQDKCIISLICIVFVVIIVIIILSLFGKSPSSIAKKWELESRVAH